MTWLPHGPLAASSDAFGTRWCGGGWHTLTTAQRSRERGTLLGESISSLAGAFRTEGTAQSWAEGDSGLISWIFAHGEPWLSDGSSLEGGDFFLAKKEPQTQWLTLNLVDFHDELGKSVLCSCSSLSPPPSALEAGAIVNREHPVSCAALKPAPVPKSGRGVFGRF